MKTHDQSRLLNKIFVVLILGLIALGISRSGLESTSQVLQNQPTGLAAQYENWQAERSAANTVQAAWHMAQQSGAYSFQTELVQTTYHPPRVTNVGREAEVDTLFLQGQTDLQKKSMEISLWQSGQSTSPENATQVRVDGDQAYGRTSSLGEWEPIDNFTGSFAPASDLLAYLHGARNFQEVTPLNVSYRQFTFDVDGPAFAEYIRTQMEAELRRAGKLPLGLTLDASEEYRAMLGSGEIWLNENGLPQHMQMDIQFPQQPDGSRVKVAIQSNFSNYAPLEQTAFTLPGSQAGLPGEFAAAAANLARSFTLGLRDGQIIGQIVGFLFILGLLVLVLVYGRRPQVYTALALTVILSMVVTPLLQSAQVQAYYADQAAEQKALAARQAEKESEAQMTESIFGGAWNAQQDPLETAENLAAAQTTLEQQQADPTAGFQISQGQTAGRATEDDLARTTDSDGDGLVDGLEHPDCINRGPDCDGDGLTDLQEYRLGTNPTSKDTDGDDLQDGMEVRGFGSGGILNGKWYSNPNSIDTNRDGLPDNLECWQDATLNQISSAMPSATPCDRDTDGDGVPDIFDLDNDNDGVDDKTDLSPFSKLSGPFSYGNPFTFQLSAPNDSSNPVFVELQLVPTDRNQISYANNILEWPGNDNQGQIQVAKTDSEKNKYNENGNLVVVPMLEVKLPISNVPFIASDSYVVTRTFAIEPVVKVFRGNHTSQVRIEAIDNGAKTRVTFASLLDERGEPVDTNGNPVMIDKIQIVPSDQCSKNSISGVVSTIENAVLGSTLEIELPLSKVLNGSHALYYVDSGHEFDLGGFPFSTSISSCNPLGDLPNGALPENQVYDIRPLETYGISLRDVQDDRGNNTHLVLYVPVNIVSGTTGGEKQALAAQIPYLAPKNNLNSAHEVRLLWMIQLLDDNNQVQFIHTYANESWTVSGFSARQDTQIQSAIIYQDPNHTATPITDRKAQTNLLIAAKTLDERFLQNPDGKTEGRVNLAANLPATALGAPAGSLVVNYQDTYTSASEMLADIVTRRNPQVLANFESGGTYKNGYDHALLLYAVRQTYRQTNLDTGFKTTSGTIGLELPAITTTLASYNWKPFRYSSTLAQKWSTIPISEYVDLLTVNLEDALKNSTPKYLSSVVPEDRPDYLDGLMLAVRSFAVSNVFGASRVVQVGEAITPEKKDVDTDPVEDTGDAFEKVAGVVLEPFLESLEASAIARANRATNTKKLVVVATFMGKMKNQKANSLPIGKPDGSSKLATAGAVAAAGLPVVMMAITIAGISFNPGNKPLSVVLSTTPLTIELVLSSIEMFEAVKDVTNGAKAAKATGTAANAANGAKAAASITKTTVVLAVVALVITGVVAVGAFIYQWAAGQFNIADLAFTDALADLIAKLVVAVILFALTFVPIVGPIILAVFAVVDALAALTCKVLDEAGVNPEKGKINIPRTGFEFDPCEGLTGVAEQIVKFGLFSQTVLVGNMDADDRLNISNFNVNLTDPNVGFQVGNAMQPSVRVDNKIVLVDQPINPSALKYFWQFNWDNLDDATHLFDLVTNDKDEGKKPSLDQMEDKWMEMGADGQLVTRRPVAGIGYDDPLHMEPATAKMETSIAFPTAGLNQQYDVYIRARYANPAQECWSAPIPPFGALLAPAVCYIRKSPTTNFIPMPQIFDIFPSNLTGFYQAATKSNGATLAWGETSSPAFPAMVDFDGDGLRSAAFNGNDPDDRFWDTDNDGLSDPFEIKYGTDPNRADTDADGLTDRQELLFGTNPALKDTDADGLWDCEEVFHQVLVTDAAGKCGAVGSWYGGWGFVYDLGSNGIPVETWVTSDPTTSDGDGDTLTDAQEKIFGFHPGVVSDPDVLGFIAKMREVNAPVALLRFEERAGANLFSDFSGLTNNATCAGNTCPVAGHEARYTNGLVFDGTDDYVTIKEVAPLKNSSFTVAFWAKRQAAGQVDIAFRTGPNSTNQGLHIGFRDNNKFICAFFGNDLDTSASYTDTDWHHWACTYDHTTHQRTIYRDGQQVAQDTSSAHYQGSGEWTLGKEWGTHYFGGMLDEFTVFNSALSQGQVERVRDARYNPGGANITVAPGDLLAYEGILENKLLGRTMQGLMQTYFPSGFGTSSASAIQSFKLAAAKTKTIRDQFNVPAGTASGVYNLAQRADAVVVDARGALGYPVVYFPFDQPPANDPYRQPDNYAYDPPQSPGQGGFSSINTVYDTSLKAKGTASLALANLRYIQLPKAFVDTADFTFAAWVYWKGDGDWQRIFDFGQSSSRSMVLTPKRSGDNGWQFNIQGQNNEIVSVPGNRPFPKNQWAHVAVTLQGNTGIIYLNGAEVGRGTINQNPSDVAGNNNYIGKSQTDGDPFNGNLDDLFIFHRALSEGEIARMAELPPDILFTFDNQNLDYAPGKSASVWSGTVSYDAGISGSGLRFNGESNIQFSAGNLTNFSDKNFTIAAWVKPETNDTTRTIFGQPPDILHQIEKNSDAALGVWNNRTGGLYLLHKGADLLLGTGTGGDTQETGWMPGVLSVNAWNHVVVTTNGGNMEVYVNGVLKETLAIGTASPTNLSHLSFGEDNYCAQFNLRAKYVVTENDSGKAEFVSKFVFQKYNASQTMDYNYFASAGDYWPNGLYWVYPGGQPFEQLRFITWKDKNYGFCNSEQKIFMFEDDGGSDDDEFESGDDPLGNLILHPRMRDNFVEGQFEFKRSPSDVWNQTNMYWHTFSWDGDEVRMAYTIHNKALPFLGVMDDLRIYNQGLTQRQVLQLYEAQNIPFHFRLDDPPGAGVDGLFNFRNEGNVAGSAREGTCSRAECPTSGLPGRINRAAYFDGTEFITVSGQSGGSEFNHVSYSFWIKTESNAGGKIIDTGVFVSLENGKVCYTTGFFKTCAIIALQANTWTMVTLTNRPSGGVNIYYNTSDVSPYPGETNPLFAVTLKKNAIFTIGNGFRGMLDDVKVLANPVISGWDLLQLYRDAPAMMLHLENPVGTFLFTNEGGSWATCTLGICPKAGVPGQVGTGVDFDGVDDYLTLPYNLTQTMADFTFAAWVFWEGGQPWQRIFDLGRDGTHSMILTPQKAGGGWRFNIQNGAILETIEIPSTRAFPINQWVHVAVTLQGDTGIIYFNGTEAGRGTITINPNQIYGEQNWLGKSQYANDPYFNGRLDEVAIYGAALNEFEVLDLYDSQKAWVGESQSFEVLVDADAPTSNLDRTLPLANNYYPNVDKILEANASDASTEITLVELGVTPYGGQTRWTAAQACDDAFGSSAWCPWFTPTNLGGEGRYTLQTRATDAVGNRETPSTSYMILVDTSAPLLAMDQAASPLLPLFKKPGEETGLYLALSGTVSDPVIPNSGGIAGSGVAQVWVEVRTQDGAVVGSGPYAAALSGNTWSFDYPFIIFNPAGTYTLRAEAVDNLGNPVAIGPYTVTLDGTAPGIVLDDKASGLPLETSEAAFSTEIFLNASDTLKGWLSEHPFPGGAQAGYLFEETSGEVFLNALNQMFNAAGCTGSTCPNPNVPGYAGSGVDFDGVDDYLTLPYTLTQSADFSFAAWVYWRGGASGQPIFSFGQDADNALWFSPGVDGQAQFMLLQNSGVLSDVITADALPTNTWVHLALVVEGDAGRIYLDGVQTTDVITLTVPLTGVVRTQNFLGRSQTGSAPSFNGRLDSLVILPRALSDREVQTLAAGPVVGVTQVEVSFTPLWAVPGILPLSQQPAPAPAGQVLHLPLNDLSQNGSAGTYQNLADPAQPGSCPAGSCPGQGSSPVGAAASFDGLNDFVSLPEDFSSALAASSDFTFAAWVYWQGGGEWQRIFDFGADSGHFMLLTPKNNENLAQFYIRNPAVIEKVTLNAPLTTNQWSHIAVTLQGNTGIIYLNGVEAGRSTINLNPMDVLGSLNYLGRSRFNNPYFNGMMSDVQVFNRALTPGELGEVSLASGASFVLDMEIPTISGGTVLGESDFGFPAEMRSGTGDTAIKAAPGKTGQWALELDGVNDYVSLPAGLLSNLTDFSFAAWVFWEGGSIWQRIFDIGQNTNTYMFLTPRTGDANNLRFEITPNGSPGLQRLNAQAALPENQWVHVAVTLEGSIGKLWLNGVLQDTNPNMILNPSDVAGANSWLGRSQFVADSYFNGKLDDVRFYARALNRYELMDLANSGWRTASLAASEAGVIQSEWSLSLPSGLEGVYKVDLMGTDTAGLRGFNNQEPAINLLMDTTLPKAELTKTFIGNWGANRVYTFAASDRYLHRLSTPCENAGTLVTTAAYFDENGWGLAGLSGSCTLWYTPTLETTDVCDLAGNCTSASPETRGSLPGAVVRSTSPAANEALVMTGLVASGSLGRSVVEDDSYIVVERTVLHVAAPGVLSNDVDLEGDPLVVLPGSVVPPGSLLLSKDGGFTYTPPQNFTGLVAFTYDVYDMPGLLAYLPVDENTGMLAADVSGSGSDGALENGAGWTTSTPSALQFDNTSAIHFDGVDDYVSLPGNFPATTDFSFSAWVYWQGGDDWQRIFGFGSGEVFQMFLTPRSAGGTLMFGITENEFIELEQLTAPQPLPQNQWVHVAVTLEDDLGKLWVNGVLQSVQPVLLDPAQVVGSDAWLGRSPAAADPYFNGSLDEVRVYDYALSTEEIEGLANGEFLGAQPQTAAVSIEVLPITRGELLFETLPANPLLVGVPAAIGGLANPPSYLESLTMTVGGAAIYQQTFVPARLDEISIAPEWTPLAPGAYQVILTGRDTVSGTASITTTLYVEDGVLPTASLETSTVITPAVQLRSGYVDFLFSAADSTGVLTTTVSIERPGAAQSQLLPTRQVSSFAPVGYINYQPVYTATQVQAGWLLEPDAMPDGEVLVVRLVVFDLNGPITYTYNVTVDLFEFQVGEVAIQPSGTRAAADLPANSTTRSALFDVSISIPAVGSDAGLYYGWTGSYTSTLDDLTLASDPTQPTQVAATFTRTVAEGGTNYFFHAWAADSLGNWNVNTYGPFYHDLPGTPDLVQFNTLFASGPYRGWMGNGCTLLGTDTRIPAQHQDGAALNEAQSLHLTWDAQNLHLVWTGANWDTDGDLFVYLDTIPDTTGPYRAVGTHRVYDPYTSTMDSTIILLPTEPWSDDPDAAAPEGASYNAMNADYALWVANSQDAFLLRWDQPGQAWVNEGPLADLGGQFGQFSEVDATLTDLVVPFALVGNPQDWAAPFPEGPRGIGLVALAVDGPEGPSGGLRIWSVLPDADPADSARVVDNAIPANRPHRLVLTDRYTFQVEDGICFEPEANLEFFLSTSQEGIAFDAFADEFRLAVPELVLDPADWDALFAPYSADFNAWLTNEFCPAAGEFDPAYRYCRPDKPAQVDPLRSLASLLNTSPAPVQPGEQVTYTLLAYNPAAVSQTLPAYLYTNGSLNQPESGVAWVNLAWTDGCTGWLELELLPGQNRFEFSGVVQPDGVASTTLDINPAYGQVGCVLNGETTHDPQQRLHVSYTPDTEAPAMVRIAPALSSAGPISTTLYGFVIDASPVSTLEFEVTRPNQATTSFSCVDPAPLDTSFACLWNIAGTNLGLPADGDVFYLRVRGTDAFNQTSLWSWPHKITIDTDAPLLTVDEALASGFAPPGSRNAITPTLVSDVELRLAGVISDTTVPAAVEVCDANGEDCQRAALTIDPFDLPEASFTYSDVASPTLSIETAAVCGVGTSGLERTMVITDSFTIAGLEVGLRLSHPYRSDLSAVLVSPLGTQVSLFSFSQPQLLTHINARFSDLALFTLADGLSSHSLEPAYAYTTRPDQALSAFNGEAADGTWTLTLCDSDPASDTGVYMDAALYFDREVEPLTVSGAWEYLADVSGLDSQLVSWTLFSVDQHGNRTALPYNLSVLVDNIAPVITATHLAEFALKDQYMPLFTGEISDGSALTPTLYVQVVDPLGAQSYAVPEYWLVSPGLFSWTYGFTPTQDGAYAFNLYGSDEAGNYTIISGYTTMVLLPPTLAYGVTPNTAVEAGGPITYQVQVTNPNFAGTAEDLLVTLQLSPHIEPADVDGGVVAGQTLTWNLPDLAARQTITYTVLANLTSTLVFTIPTQVLTDTGFALVDLAGSTISATVTAATSNLGSVGPVNASFTVAGGFDYSQLSTSLMEFKKSVIPDVNMEPGGMATYTLQITNTTNVTVTDLVFSDTLVPLLSPINTGGASYDTESRTLTWPPVSLPAGETMSVIFTAQLGNDQSAIDALQGQISNVAYFSSSLETGISNRAVFTAPYVLVAFDFIKSVWPGSEVEPGDELVYTITVTNIMAMLDAADLVVTDTLPAGLELVDAGEAAYDSESRTLTWNIGTLTDTETVTLTFTARLVEDLGLLNELGGDGAPIANTSFLTTTNLLGAESNPAVFTMLITDTGPVQYKIYLPLVARQSSGRGEEGEAPLQIPEIAPAEEPQEPAPEAPEPTEPTADQAPLLAMIAVHPATALLSRKKLRLPAKSAHLGT